MDEKLKKLFIMADNGYGLFILRNNHFVYTNEKFDEIFGYNRNEIINLIPSNLFRSNEGIDFFNRIIFVDNLFKTSKLTGFKKNKDLIEINLKEIYRSSVNNSFITYGLIDVNPEETNRKDITENYEIITVRNINGEIAYSNNFFKQIYSSDCRNFLNWYEIEELVLKTGIIKYKKDLKFPDGTIKYYKIIKIPLIDYEKGIKEIICIGNLIDDSQLKEIEENTFIEMDDINTTIDSKTAITVLNNDFKYIYVNDYFCNSINYTREELLGTTFNEANSGYHDKKFFENIYSIIKTGKVWRGNVSSIGKNGRFKKANVTIIPFLNANDNTYKYVTIRNDFFNEELLEESNKQKTIIDLLEEHINKRDKNKILALLIIEIEEYNLLQRIHGELIIERIKEHLHNKLKMYSNNRIDSIYLSENIIACIINDINDFEQVDIIADQVSGFSKGDNSLEGYGILTSFIVGVGIYSNIEESSVNLLNNAYFALELAKMNKTRYQIYHNELVEKKYREYILKNELFNALNNKQLYLYYQPRFNNKKIIIGAEALIRWEHPKLGMIPPDDFIYIAEQTGLIVPIGEWVIRTACEQGTKLINEGFKPIKISVNASPIQLLQENFARKVKGIIDETKFDIDFFEIEITEDSIKANEKVIESIGELRELGISIAVDDFGTGYSSFELLKNINFDTLKIDQIFTLSIMDDKRSKDIIASLINLALDLNLSIIAEGVENEGQFEELKSLSCNEYQGYLLSKPIPVHLFKKYLESQFSIDFERRKSFRYNFQFPIEALLEISEINKVQMKSGKILIDIDNICKEGLCFRTNINFSIIIDYYILNFYIKTKSEDIVIQGIISWSKKENDYYKYGVQFTSEYQRTNSITKIIEYYYRIY